MPILGFLLALLIGAILAMLGAFTLTSVATSATPAPVTAPLVSYGAR